MREEAKKKRKKEREKQKKEELRKQGKLLTKAEKEKQQKNKLVLEQLQQQGVSFPKEGAKKFSIYDIKKKKKIENKKEEKIEKEEEEIKDSWEDDEVVEDWEIDEIKKDEKEEEKEEKKEIKEEKIKEETKPQSTKPQIVKKALKTNKDLRSPICCILGHVDTGKTKLLDKIRQTNVQEGEAGGITQQIGATYFPASVIQEKTIDLQDQFDLEVPGLLVIDTPGHESFTNLRTRGSSLCNIAVLVVDIMHGLEPQTLESISLLRQRKTPFIVALNKIDRIYGWQEYPNKPFNYSFEKQSESVKKEYHERLRSTILSFAEQGLNAIEYYNNNDYRKYVSLVPTSAITGEGIPDLLYLLIHLTQKMMSKSLMYLSELECTVLEVKVIEGLGTTIDVILSNGILREGDKIAVCGLNGPIITTIRALLTPQPLRELRVKSQYVHHKMVKAALGVKIVASDLDKAIAGSRLIKIEDDEDEDEAAEEVMTDLTTLLNSIDKSGRGVCVQASTLGSLEALLSFLKDSKIPVSGVNIGPVHKKDVIRTSIMLEHAREYAVLLAFDVKVDKDAQELADQLGIKIFKAEIIYHLFDHFTNYMKELIEQKKKDSAPQAIFPCVLRIVSGCVFNKRDPIVVGVDVIEGTLRVGTPICVPSQNNVFIGKVSSIEMNHKPQDSAKKGGPSVAIRIDTPSYDTPKMVGRHFTEKDDLVSQITRASIDVLKENFRNEMTNDDWQLIIRLKKALNIQ
ncbi:P-loop containing nucleoside triphosphate hydrolase protein [Rozella allomycis CSF55]|uniref:Eukaryotic translation initiation factor 5B n=1 Tax=Rozella allomycis (strain CSF55) TaxID=988480 RepID=A0A4P9YFM8_ROZAC|nr:P-loop containing nucleoside triphosphate hydrolase protein [Rozella allomycis CSF55]